MRDEFAAIYAERSWHRRWGSGPGSNPMQLEPWIRTLAEVIAGEGVTRVADLGCGDWSFSVGVNWTGVDYTGVDVVPSVVAELTERHARDGVRFLQGDLLRDPLPQAELAILKDVLQHWPTRSILELVPRLAAYPLVLLVNDREIVRRRLSSPWRESTVVAPNQDIGVAGYRPLRLLDPPFRLPAERLLEFDMREGRTRFRKEVLLLRHPHR